MYVRGLQRQGSKSFLLNVLHDISLQIEPGHAVITRGGLKNTGGKHGATVFTLKDVSILTIKYLLTK